MSFPRFSYSNDTIIAFNEANEPIASGSDFVKVAETAEQYFTALRGEKANKLRETATHIVTPNGMKGKVLNRVAALWGDEITVRMENNEIRTFATAPGDGLTYTHEKTASTATGYLEYFKGRLDELPDHDIRGLTARLNVLDEVKTGVRSVIGSVSHGDQQALDQIVLTADAEAREIKDTLEYLATADAESYRPPAPYELHAVEQADMAHGASDNWLDVTARQMIAESEAQDFDKLLDEGPTSLVSRLETSALSDSGIIAEIARNEITSKTAGFQGEAVEDYRDHFIAATELARRQELTYRNDTVREAATKHEASVAQIPDAGLFL
jgi:hypothetical protein